MRLQQMVLGDPTSFLCGYFMTVDLMYLQIGDHSRSAFDTLNDDRFSYFKSVLKRESVPRSYVDLQKQKLFKIIGQTSCVTEIIYLPDQT